jgi:hypothetical protein
MFLQTVRFASVFFVALVALAAVIVAVLAPLA